MAKRMELVGETETGDVADDFRTAHDQLWDELDAAHASLVREALVRAQELREKHVDPGDAYLEGFIGKLALEPDTSRVPAQRKGTGPTAA